jgi:hypothetical protein
MTEGEKESHKEKIKKVMLEHLTAVGYPNITDDQVMAELKNMWVKMEEAGLILSGMSYMGFQQMANNAYLMNQVKNMMGL